MVLVRQITPNQDRNYAELEGGAVENHTLPRDRCGLL